MSYHLHAVRNRPTCAAVHPRAGDTGAVTTPSAVVTDLDGTLWQTADRVHPRTLGAVRTVVASGVPLLVATGRRPTSTRAPLARLGLTPAAVVLNGALGLDLATGERFHRAPFAAPDATRVLDAFLRADVEPCVYVDAPGIEACLGSAPSTNPAHQQHLAPTARFGSDLRQVCAQLPVLAFGVIGVPHATLHPAAQQVGGRAEVHLDRSLDHPGMASLTVAPRHQSKWDGVVAWCARAGLDTTAVVALGDGPNDVELLHHAAVSLVPESAHPDALRLADRVIAGPSQGGWAGVLDVL